MRGRESKSVSVATSRRNGRCALALLLAALVTEPSVAQTPPSRAEIAAYQGLHAAAAKGDLAGLERLLAAKPALEVRDGHGRTPLHVAAHASQYDVVTSLAAAGADMNAKDSSRYDIVTIAAVKDDLKMLELALKLGTDPRAVTSPYDGTALIAASHLGHDGVVRALIAAGAPLDHVNNLGWTAAIEAVILGDGGPRHQATLQALVGAGANLKLADREGATPLDHARRRGYARMVEMLSAAR